jgi:hypothetical protein
MSEKPSNLTQPKTWGRKSGEPGERKARRIQLGQVRQLAQRLGFNTRGKSARDLRQEIEAQKNLERDTANWIREAFKNRPGAEEPKDKTKDTEIKTTTTSSPATSVLLPQSGSKNPPALGRPDPARVDRNRTSPFLVINRNDKDTDPPTNETQSLVTFGRGYRNSSLTSNISISGLNTWFEIASNTKIWLEFDIDYAGGAFVIDDCAVVDSTTFWGAYPEPYAFVGTGSSEQSKLYLLLATFEIVDTVLTPVQYWTGDFIMKNACYDGKPIIRPENWGG